MKAINHSQQYAIKNFWNFGKFVSNFKYISINLRRYADWCLAIQHKFEDEDSHLKKKTIS